MADEHMIATEPSPMVSADKTTLDNELILAASLHSCCIYKPGIFVPESRYICHFLILLVFTIPLSQGTYDVIFQDERVIQRRNASVRIVHALLASTYITTFTRKKMWTIDPAEADYNRSLGYGITVAGPG
jgi:hypothetical protein